MIKFQISLKLTLDVYWTAVKLKLERGRKYFHMPVHNTVMGKLLIYYNKKPQI